MADSAVTPIQGCPTCSCGCGDGCDCGTDCATGAVQQSSAPLATNHLSFSFGFSNLATNGTGGSAANPNMGMGNNIFVSYWAYATTDGSNVAFVLGPNRTRRFPSGGGAELYGSRFTMETSGGYYYLADPDTGNVYTFVVSSGLLWKITPPGNPVSNEIIENTFSGSQIIQTTRTLPYTTCDNDLTTVESLLYTYFPTGTPSAGLLQFATLTRTDATTVQIRRLAMGYYGTNDPGGNPGDLMTVALQQLEGTEWATIWTKYYRYYTGAAGQPGYQYGLKFVVGPDAFARLSAVTNAFTAPDELVAQFADYYYEYIDIFGVEPRRVTKSVTAGGTLPHLFGYENSSFPNAYNNWSLKCTATHADGSQALIFSNFAAQVMLTDFWAAQNNQPEGRWIDYTQYDPANACATVIYSPAAINMNASLPPYNDAYANLDVQLNANAGLVTTRTYTSVGTSPAFPNYLAQESVQEGAAGTPTPVKSFTYAVYSVSPAAVVMPTAATNYPDGETPITTAFTNTPFSGTAQIQQKVTTLPVIPSFQNGDGNTYTITELFDIQGRPTQTYDPVVSGTSLTNMPSMLWIYDEPTGAVIQSIRNPYIPAASAPDNWEYNLTTDFLVDLLGRTIQTLGPAFLSPLSVAQAAGETPAQGALVQVRAATWTVFRDVQHEIWTASGYATGSTLSEYAFTLQNPVSIARMDHDGRTLDSIRAVRRRGVPPRFQSGETPLLQAGALRPAPSQFVESQGALSAGDAFPQISFVRWTQNVYNDAHDLVAVRRYSNIPLAGPGLRGENYDESRCGYDLMNRRNMFRAAGGTIRRTVFDVRNNPTEIFVGTEDAGATDEAPDGFGAPGNNMQNTVTNIYDDSNPVGGDNLLTSVVRHIDFTPENDYRSDFAYDFRHRRTGTTDWIDFTTGTYVFTARSFDNNSNVKQVQQFNSTSNTAFLTALIRQSNIFYDWWQRVYQTQRWGVNMGSSSPLTNALTGQTWYNALNRPVKQIAEGGSAAYTKTTYDQANRVSGVYVGYTGFAGSDANNFAVNSSDKIFEQTQFTVDAASNTTLVMTFQRNNGDNTTEGELTFDPTGATNPWMNFTAFWQDGVGRPLASANYGNVSPYGTAVPGSTPLALPASSASVLVSQTAYNNRSEAYLSTDPAGMVSRTDTDDAGRAVRTIQNYISALGGAAGSGAGGGAWSPLPLGEGQGEGLFSVEGSWGPAFWSCAPATTGPDVNVTVLTDYTPDDNVTTLTAVNPATGNQTTQFLFGVTLANSAIARNDLLAAVLYPDAADSTDSVQYQYNLQSESAQMQDQNGTVHQYFRDQLGRQISDIAVTLGAGVYGSSLDDFYAVRRIDTAYEIRGMVNQVTSWLDTAGTVLLNQISSTFGDFEQLITEEQDQSGSVGPTVTVGYTTGEGGATNSVRPLTVVYPYGSTTLAYYYGTSGGDDDSLGRVTSASFGGSTVVSYGYFGLAGIASVTYGTATPIVLTLASGGTYPGFDLFNRVVENFWKQSGTILAGQAYGYNLASSRLYRYDALTDVQELYGYDGVQRLLTFNRGPAASVTPGAPPSPLTSLSLQQTWELDSTGNWNDFSSLDLVTPANSLVQQRTSNTANEIIDITATVSAAWATPAYDRNGNMTTIPQPTAMYPTENDAATFDAWNRLASLTNSVSSALTTYRYDGLHRRVSSTVSGTTRWFVNNSQWQVLEEYLGTSTTPNRRYVWGIRYVDDLVLRDRTTTGTLIERMYALQDANWNVVAIYNNTTNAIVERYAYTAYGVCQFLNASFGSLSGSAYDWTVLYTGRVLDDESGLYYYRMRYYHPALGVFVSKDRLEDDHNPYRYGSNSPTNTVDPSGGKTCTCTVSMVFSPLKIFSGRAMSRIVYGSKSYHACIQIDTVCSDRRGAIEHHTASIELLQHVTGGDEGLLGKGPVYFPKDNEAAEWGIYLKEKPCTHIDAKGAVSANVEPAGKQPADNNEKCAFAWCIMLSAFNVAAAATALRTQYYIDEKNYPNTCNSVAAEVMHGCQGTVTIPKAVGGIRGVPGFEHDFTKG